MGALHSKIRPAVERRVSGLPPERWHRVRLAADAIERFADGRRLAVRDAGSGDGQLATLLAEARPSWEVVAGDQDEAGPRAGQTAARDGVSNLDLRQIVSTENSPVATGLHRRIGKRVLTVVGAIAARYAPRFVLGLAGSMPAKGWLAHLVARGYRSRGARLPEAPA